MEVKNGVVRFEHVNFRYPGAEEDVLHDIDFVAESGKTTAIIGSTGCRKSTLVNLIPRLYDVTGGSITLDGKDIRRIVMNKSYRNTVEIASYANQLAGITDMDLFDRHGQPVEELFFKGKKQQAMEAALDELVNKLQLGAEQFETAALILRTESEAKEAARILKEKLENTGFDMENRFSYLHSDSIRF